MEDDELRVWIAVRRDLDLPHGKFAVQVAHAVATLLMEKADAGTVRAYMQNSQPKIVVAAKNLSALDRTYEECLRADLAAAYIVDETRTILPSPTATSCAVGPCTIADLPPYVRRLRLYQPSDNQATS